MMIENPVVAVLLARLILGSLFFFQGFDKVFRIGISNVSEEFSMQLNKVKMPKIFFSLMAYLTSYIELIAGAMLFLGLFVDVVLIILSLNLFLVALAFSIINPIWDMKVYLPRLLLLLFLLCVPESWFAFGLDQIFNY
jgi:uncharacterized membrane protein YphA (DoxX/SURF4 family)